jgi:apolipoprotein N-acyltransferase
VLATLGVVLTTLYGTYRMHEVDERASRARHLHVAMVQVNMGTFEKDEDPIEGFRRHLEQSARVEREWHPDLLVWPESAFTFFVPDIPNLKNYVLGDIETPTLFGGLARRRVHGRVRDYNTAFLVGGNGAVLGHYDKVELIPFGEYIPLGDVIPAIYDLSPNSGMFTPGRSVQPLVLDGVKMTTLICYEDLLPRFVRRAVLEADPHVLVNLTNDAWYGDTAEPWTHLALAKFRAIEHHRALIRSTNSGVSAFVDPVGRVVSASGVYTRENLHAEVPMLRGHTVFEWIGELPFLVLSIAALVVMNRRAFRRRREVVAAS